MTLGDLLAIIDNNIEVDVWGRNVDTQLSVEVGNYTGEGSIDSSFYNCQVTSIENPVIGFLDVTIDCEIGYESDELEDVETSSCIEASNDEDWDEDDFFDPDMFSDIELEVWDALGLYVDMSSIRYGEGTLFIYSDPNGENDSDIWMGDDDDELASIDYQEYSDTIQDIMKKPQSQWKSLYKKYLESVIN